MSNKSIDVRFLDMGCTVEIRVPTQKTFIVIDGSYDYTI